MPLKTSGLVSRSQLQSEVFQALKETLGKGEFFSIESFEAWSPTAGETLSAVLGTIVPEIEKPSVKRNGGFSYIFIPSQLRTKYGLDYITINLPKIEVLVGAAKVGEPEGEFEFEQGWFGNLKIAGQNYFSPTFASTSGTLKTTEAGGENFVIPQKFIQVSFTQTIDAIAGVSIEFEAIPFVRILKVSKKTKIKPALLLPSLLLVAERVKPVTNAILVGSQEFVA